MERIGTQAVTRKAIETQLNQDVRENSVFVSAVKSRSLVLHLHVFKAKAGCTLAQDYSSWAGGDVAMASNVEP